MYAYLRPSSLSLQGPQQSFGNIIVLSAVGQAVRGQCTGNLQILSGNVVTHDVNMFVPMCSVRGVPTGLPRKYLLVNFTQIFARLETQCRCVSHILKPIYSYALGIAKKVMSGKRSCQHTPVMPGQLVKAQS